MWSWPLSAAASAPVAFDQRRRRAVVAALDGSVCCFGSALGATATPLGAGDAAAPAPAAPAPAPPTAAPPSLPGQTRPQGLPQQWGRGAVEAGARGTGVQPDQPQAKRQRPGSPDPAPALRGSAAPGVRGCSPRPESAPAPEDTARRGYLPLWRYQAGAPIFGRPAVEGSSGTVLCATVAGALLALSEAGARP